MVKSVNAPEKFPFLILYVHRATSLSVQDSHFLFLSFGFEAWLKNHF